jgi:hypothetical protein
MTTAELLQPTENNPRSNKLLKAAGFTAVAAIGIAGGLKIAQHITDNNPIDTYNHTFTDPGKCLDNTPFDINNGNDGATASYYTDKKSAQEILTILPHAANSLSPSVLEFTFNDKGQIFFADHQTGSFLVDAGCIDANSGQ